MRSDPFTGLRAVSPVATAATSSASRSSAVVNNWHYRFVAQDDGTVVTESFWTPEPLLLRPFTFLGEPRRRRNIRDMTRTLERIKAEVEKR